MNRRGRRQQGEAGNRPRSWTRRWPPGRPLWPWALGATLLLAPLLLLFALLVDATWLRPLIQQHIQQRSGRQVDFDDLRLGFDGDWQPTVWLQNLRVQNAAWAHSRQPLLRAASFSATFSWASLLQRPMTVTRLTVVDAEAELERQADGLRNWRLTRPNDRGPGRIRVLSIDAQRTVAHVRHDGVKLEVDLSTTPLATPQSLPGHTGLPLTKTVTARGVRDGIAFHAEAVTSSVLTLLGSGQPFALRATLQTALSHLRAEGTLADVREPGAMDLVLDLQSRRIDELTAAWNLAPSRSALAASASGHLQKEGPTWRLTDLQARLGRSDAAGSVTLQQAGGDPPGTGRAASGGDVGAAASNADRTVDQREATRYRVQAALRSALVDAAELRQWSRGRQATGAGAAQATSRAPKGTLRRSSADVDWQVARVEGLVPAVISQLKTRATLTDSVLRLAPLEFALYGGRGSGSLSLDSSRSPAEARADLLLRDLRLAQLRPAATSQETLQGALDLRLALRADGSSGDGWKHSASGSVHARLVDAGLPASLEAKLGLDGGRWLRAVLGADQRVAVTCSAFELDFERGQGQVRQFALETAHLSLAASGRVDLPQGRYTLLVTPQRKQAALLALDKSLQVEGGLQGVQTRLVERPQPLPRLGTCAAGRLE